MKWRRADSDLSRSAASNVGHGGAAFYGEKHSHAVAAVKFWLVDWEKVRRVALYYLKR